MIESYRARGEVICKHLVREIRMLGFTGDQVASLNPAYHEACFETGRDPFSGEATLCGHWRGPSGRRVGEIKFHGDGSFFAEYDVLLPHPKDPRWFVEGVIAWGRDDLIKSEPKLLPALGD